MLKIGHWSLLLILFSKLTIASDPPPIIPITACLDETKTLCMSSNWAQEWIGIDLIYTHLKNLEEKEFNFGMIDGGVIPQFALGKITEELRSALGDRLKKGLINQIPDKHGTAVLNLINAPTPVGVNPYAKLAFFHPLREPFDIRNSTQLLRKNKISVLNLAGQLPTFRNGTTDDFTDLLKKVVLVQASGNDYPEKISSTPLDSRFLKVGSLHPFGILTYNTNLSFNFLVPSDLWLQTYIDKYSLKYFGETSGASGLVTGFLSLLLGLFPEFPQEAILPIILKTALPSPNGPILNAYKTYRCVDRIYPQLLRGDKWQHVFKKETLCDFKEEAKTLFETLNNSIGNPTQNLRKAVLLDPETADFRHKLINFYKVENQKASTYYWELFEKDGVEKVIEKGLNGGNWRSESTLLALIRALEHVQVSKRIKALKLFLRRPRSESIERMAIASLLSLKEKAIPLIIEKIEDPKSNLRKELLDVILELNEQKVGLNDLKMPGISFLTEQLTNEDLSFEARKKASSLIKTLRSNL